MFSESTLDIFTGKSSIVDKEKRECPVATSGWRERAVKYAVLFIKKIIGCSSENLTGLVSLLYTLSKNVPRNVGNNNIIE